MPFNDNFDGYYSQLIKPLVESKGFACERADEIYNNRAIILDIFEKIESSSFVIADVTEKNPNVAYELGLAHALNKPVVIISQTLDDVPFDFKHIRICTYKPKAVDWASKLSSSISKSIDSIMNEPEKSLIHLFSNNFSREKQSIIKHLNELYMQYESILSIDSDYYVKDEKTTLVKKIYTIIPKTNMLHFYQIFRVENDGNFKILKVQDPTTYNDLDYIIHKHTDTELSFIILTKNLEEIDKPFRIEIQLELDNHFDNLFAVGVSEYSFHALSKSRSSYKSMHEKVHFPKEEKFANSLDCATLSL